MENESRFSQSVLDAYKKLFSEESSIENIEIFERTLFINYAKLILSGDYFINKTENIDIVEKNISKYIEHIIPPDEQENIDNSILRLQNCIEITHLTQYIIGSNHFKEEEEICLVDLHDEKDIKKDKYLEKFSTVCKVCSFELSFQYNENYILNLGSFRRIIQYYIANIKNKEDEVYKILYASLYKIELQLYKLSFLLQNYKYHFAIDHKEIKEDIQKKYKQTTFGSLSELFLHPEKSKKEVEEWRKNVNGESSEMYAFVMLMRYYTKVTGNNEQIENLFQRSKEKVFLTKNKVDNLAQKSFNNFMFNCRFSFRCKNNQWSDWKELRQEIKSNNNPTNDFYPYLKATEYLFQLLDNHLKTPNKCEINLQEVFNYANECYEQYNKILNYSKQHRPYFLQLNYDFCCIDLQEKGIDFNIFCPSSFVLPIDYLKKEEEQISLMIKRARLEDELLHFEERKSIIQSFYKINDMERHNLELITFGISVASIFIGLIGALMGNNNTVPNTERFYYVLALAMCVGVFDCIGYIFFVFRNFKEDTGKLITSILFLLICLGGLVYLAYHPVK